MSDRPRWILISKTPARKLKNIRYFFVLHHRHLRRNLRRNPILGTQTLFKSILMVNYIFFMQRSSPALSTCDEIRNRERRARRKVVGFPCCVETFRLRMSEALPARRSLPLPPRASDAISTRPTRRRLRIPREPSKPAPEAPGIKTKF